MRSSIKTLVVFGLAAVSCLIVAAASSVVVPPFPKAVAAAACPSTVEESFGLSFGQLRNKCFDGAASDETKYPVALTCAQIRTIATKKDDPEWSEGMVAEAARAKYCAFSADDTVGSGYGHAIPSGSGIYPAVIAFSDGRCPVEQKTAVTIIGGKVSFSVNKNLWSGILDDAAWLRASTGAGAAMGPIHEAEIYDPVCGVGTMALVDGDKV